MQQHLIKMKSAWLCASWLPAITAVAVVIAAAPGSVFAQGEHDHHMHAMHDAASTAYTRSVGAYQIPDVNLVDMSGAMVSLRKVLDGDDPIMLNFIYTSCTAICPVMSATFAGVQDQLGAESKKVRMVSISIDPENDTPAKLRAYANKYHAEPQWKMLTGSAENSIAVQRAFDAFRGDKMNHSPATFIRAGGVNQPWVRLEGFASAEDIIKEYRQLALR
ncbi:MAG: SCO family protein [Sulfuriferula sp.]